MYGLNNFLCNDYHTIIERHFPILVNKINFECSFRFMQCTRHKHVGGSSSKGFSFSFFVLKLSSMKMMISLKDFMSDNSHLRLSCKLMLLISSKGGFIGRHKDLLIHHLILFQSKHEIVVHLKF